MRARARAIAARWAASGAWSPASLEVQLCCAADGAHAPPPLKVKVSDDGARAFSYDEGRTAVRTAVHDMEAGEFFALCRNGRSARRPYFVSPVSAISGGDALLERFPEWCELKDPAADAPALLSVWIGGVGTQTQAHYDNADNVFLQLAGRKRFLLWPPAAAPHLHMFPDAHCRARKSQMVEPFDRLAAANATERFPFSAALPPPRVVDLSPGDALVIPAFTFHHVEVLGGAEGREEENDDACVSVSVNVFSQCAQSTAAAALLQHSLLPLPPHDAAHFEDALRAARRVLAHLASRIALPPLPGAGAADGGARLLSLLLASRFEPLDVEAHGPIALERDAQRYSASAQRRRRRTKREYDAVAPRADDGDGDGDDVLFSDANSAAHAETLAARFAALEAAAVERAARFDADAMVGESAEQYAHGVALLQLWHVIEKSALELVRASPKRTSMRAVLRRLADGATDDA